MKVTKEWTVSCMMLLALSACGGGSSAPDPGVQASAPQEPAEDVNSDDDPNNGVLDPETGSTAPTIGPFFGGTGELRNTVTLPENGVTPLTGVLLRTHNYDTDVSAIFGRFRSPSTHYNYMSDYYRPLDSCEDVLGKLGYGDALYTGIFPFIPVSAGEVLPLLGPSGTVGEVRDNNGDGWFYQADSTESVYGDFELQISIPGAEFPGFQPLTFPTTDELKNFRSSAGDRMSDLRDMFNPGETPTFLWDASDDPNAFLHLEFNARFPEQSGSFEENSVSFHCSLIDDGEFTFPSSVIEMYPRTPSYSEVRLIARVSATEIRQQAATVLLVNVQPADR